MCETTRTKLSHSSWWLLNWDVIFLKHSFDHRLGNQCLWLALSYENLRSINFIKCLLWWNFFPSNYTRRTNNNNRQMMVRVSSWKFPLSPLLMPSFIGVFHLDLLRFVPFFKNIFSLLNFYCYVYESDPTSNRTTTTTEFIFCGFFETLFTNGEVFWKRTEIFSSPYGARIEREEIKILETLLSQTISPSFLLNRFSIGINRIRVLNIIKYLLSAVEALETDETLERSDRRRKKLKELRKNFKTYGSICRTLMITF